MANIEKYNSNSEIRRLNDSIIQNKDIPKLDMMLVQCNSSEKIRDLDKQIAISKLRLSIEMLHRDLSISKVDNINVVRIIDLVSKYFDFLTISEIRFAFELLLLGKLDSYFHKRDGIADTNAYNNLSPQFFTKVIKAYQGYKNSVMHKYNEKFKAKNEISIDDLNKHMHNLIIQQFEYFKKCGNLNIVVPNIIYNRLSKVVKLKCETLTYADYKKIRDNKLFSQNIHKSDKKNIKFSESDCKISELLKNDIKNYLKLKSIKAYFTSLINNNKDIRDILKVEK